MILLMVLYGIWHEMPMEVFGIWNYMDWQKKELRIYGNVNKCHWYYMVLDIITIGN